jgi:hypothetical protein
MLIQQNGETVILVDRPKIGSAYEPPKPNYLADDQLWIQSVFTFKRVPAYAIRDRQAKLLLLGSLYFGAVLMIGQVARFLLQR